ncbi:hypothetical protein FN846DRAFT_777421 [Sphaerosporella brunnea]|uniref:SEC7 domain-containing protein n=1 Tax=Sphaerosporella brunnea TaxID=1250544 RepID=A0A5J5F069_9PEZI|nr:hypothetical protein FN846DRAFT_777421 [Sphaerosporella brunnea]
MSSAEQHCEGRNSGGSSRFGGLLLGRIRRDSEPAFGGPGTRTSSPQPHLALSQPVSGKASHEISIPKRNDEDTPPVYLSKLFEAISKSVVASLLARNGDPFHWAVLKAYMETFDFESDPMDMALRKLLMEVELPSETQQIDRVLQAFADRYHECNPFVYKDSDQAYYIAFSLIMLHTDFFNKNNKHKMQKADYVKNTSRAIDKEGILKDILECFYANIIYTPFIRLEDEFDINGQKIVSHRPKKSIFSRAVNSYDGKRIKEPVDPYLLIIEGQLDLLRASLKDVIQFEDPYSYCGTASRLDMTALHRAFFRSGILQIVSARSRPDAFMTQQSTENPDGADPGVVEMKVTKVGLLWRKETKKKKTRSPWHEWGAILTGSQLYFFRNIAWVKSLMHQYEVHHKQGLGTPVIFKPPLEEFKPDAQISTDDAVALLDKSYKKHKNAFAFIRHGGIQEYFIADSEADMNDWLAKLNYAATFRTAGVRMRGVVGAGYDGQRLRGIRRMESVSGSSNGHSVITPTGEVSIVRNEIDHKLAAEVAAARREVVQTRIFDSEERLAVANRELQTHLRNGRHLTILTPIQPRTREQVVMAAATLAANLQWVRMQMWKLRCHRDILALDLDEERLTTREQVKNELSISPPIPTPRIAPSLQSSPSLDESAAGQTPTQANFSPLSNEQLSQVTSHSSHVPSHKSTPSGSDHAISPVTFDKDTTPGSPSASSKMVGRDDESIDNSRSHRSSSPARSYSSVGGDHDDDDKEAGKEKEKGKGKGKEKGSSRPSVRKGIQRTLRETQGIGHRRAKSNAEEALSAEKKSTGDEGLARGAGSFTVHGKKASVITFGSEWQSMSPEDRLKRNKSTQADSDAGTITGETESLHSALSFSRRGSQAAVPRKDDDSERTLLQPTPSFSRRGSNTNAKEEGLAEVPEGSTIGEETLIGKLNGFKEDMIENEVVSPVVIGA